MASIKLIETEITETAENALINISANQCPEPLPDLSSLTWNNVQNKPDFHEVAFSGDYDDLSNKPGAVDLTGYIPYEGADSDVNLGLNQFAIGPLAVESQWTGENGILTATSTSGKQAIYGLNTSAQGDGIIGEANGSGGSGSGVVGISFEGYSGVAGWSVTGKGVFGESDSGTGGHFETDTGVGVVAYTLLGAGDIFQAKSALTGSPTIVAAINTSGDFRAKSLNVKTKVFSDTATTAAGGNGEGPALNQLGYIEDCAIDSLNRLYIADPANQRIVRWVGTTSGTLVAGGNGQGSGLNQFGSWIGGMAITSNGGTIYVSDTNNHRVMKWTAGGSAGIVFAGGNGNGSALNQLSGPNAVAIGENEDLYILDTGNNRVMKYVQGATEGVVVAGGNGSGSASNQLASSSYRMSYYNGDLYIISGNDIKKWTPGEATGTIIATISGAYAIYVNAQGIYTGGSDDIVRLYEHGASTYTEIIDVGTIGAGWLTNVSISPLGDMYIVDGDNERVLKLALVDSFNTISSSAEEILLNGKKVMYANPDVALAGGFMVRNGTGTHFLKANGTTTEISATAPLTFNPTTGVIALPAATTGVSGYLSNDVQYISGHKRFRDGIQILNTETVGQIPLHITTTGTSSALYIEATTTNPTVAITNAAGGQGALDVRNNSATFQTALIMNNNASGDVLHCLAGGLPVGVFGPNGFTTTQLRLGSLNTAPASATATGTLGEIRVDGVHIYVCSATNTWVRAALATW